MKVELKKDGDCRVKLAITAEPAETRKTYEACVGAFIRQATIKGFRPGKAPRAIIEQRFGSDINRETRQRLVGELASKAAKEQNLDFTKPEIEILCELLSKDLPPADKQRVQMLMKFMKTDPKKS